MNNLKPDHLIEEQVLEPNNDIHPAVIDTPEKPKEIIFTNGEKKKKLPQCLQKHHHIKI